MPLTHSVSTVQLAGQLLAVPLHKRLLPQALRPGVPTTAKPHVPLGDVSAALQLWQSPVQVELQQTPSTQRVEPPGHMRQLVPKH